MTEPVASLGAFFALRTAGLFRRGLGPFAWPLSVKGRGSGNGRNGYFLLARGGAAVVFLRYSASHLVRFAPSLTLLVTFASLLQGGAAASGAPAAVDFNRDIQPILSENCFQCHGPDEKSRKARLRLDRPEGAFGSTESGATAVVPGKPAESELIVRIFATDPEDVMPAPKSNRTLTAAQKELLQRWVEQGAPWAEHWAFVAPQRPIVPAVPPGKFPIRNPIDAFVAARLAVEKLPPSPEAPREKLIRRVTLDLTGLPPTPAEVDAFLADRSVDAYEKIVARLLASPRYGERMVWDWLDLARYADTNGYQGDPTRTMWPWRDWVIKALNDNMPFDQFTIEQLAGDLLPDATRDQKLATGFNRNHMLNNEGGSIPEESRVGYVLDRVDTTATVWLGLTVGCARCHDHKFDPVTQREYYQLSAYFNQVPEKGNADANPMANPLLSLATPEAEAKVARLRAGEKAAKEGRDTLEAELKAAQPAWEKRVLAEGVRLPEPPWTVITPEESSSARGATVTRLPDGSVLVSGANPAIDDLVFTGNAGLRGVTALQIEALPDPSLPQGGPGRADDGTFVLSEIKIQADGRPLTLVALRADSEREGFPLAHAIDDNPATGWSGRAAPGQPRRAIFEVRPAGVREESLLSIRLEHHAKNPRGVLGRFRLSVTNADPTTLRPLSTAALAALALPADQRSPELATALEQFYLGISSERAAAIKKFDAAKRAADAAARALLKVMVMQDLPEPRDTFVLVRGAYDQHGDKVAPGTPKVLPPLPADAPPHRLALARWLVSPDHPLTARVTVNRFWAMFFGTGLVKTAGDFGVQGEKPSHPELLDWLAREFVASGWDLKHLVRLIVTSTTYRQSAQAAPALFERDPENRFLARGPRFRLPSWMIRDQALAASGLLVEKLGGPAVNGYQPSGIWEEATFGKIKYQQDHGDALYRRSVYTFWRRIVGPTVFFDTANRQSCSVTNSRTNTPLHALTTLNDVTYVEAARVLAERMLTAGGAGDEARLAFGFRLCTARLPIPAETARLVSALARLRRQFAAAPAEAKTFVTAGESPPDPALDPVELAAHTAIATLLLNLDETLTKE
jgi:mono/diheme cytochrome c family protein